MSIRGFYMVALMFVLVFPNMLFATTQLSSESQCNETTLSAIDGNVNLRAEWTANTINLKYYNDGEELENISEELKSCEYGGGITLPLAPSKTGYSFIGWRLQPPFDLRNLSDYIETNSDSWLVHFAPLASNDNQPKCMESGRPKDCDDPVFEHLDENEWSVTFSYGSIKGESVCATNGGSYATPGTPVGTDGQHCWCRANGYAGQNNSKYQSVASPAWVYQTYNNSNCAGGCLNACASNLRNNPNFRKAIFGVTE